MRERSQVLAGPVSVASATGRGDAAALVAADVLARAARAAGQASAVATAIVAGGLGHQFATEEDLRREGLDRAAVGAGDFAARAALVHDEAGRRLGAAACALGVDLDVAAAARAGEQTAVAACVAFVRLFEAGLVVEAERVVEVCPRCATVAAGPDAVPGVVEGEALVLRLAVLDGHDAVGWLDVRCPAPELVPGIVAVAVPEGHPAAGHAVAVPVAATVVPVVADPTAVQPLLLVPAHDASDLERARRSGLAPVVAVDATGTVRAPGPLDGLARHAARAAAARLIAAEGVVAAVEPASEPVARCAACRTVLVAVLGRHWFLAVADLETAAADAVREGALVVSPPAARDELLALAGTSDDWCLSSRASPGQALPVARCADCGSVDVAVDLASSCRRCMGDLVREDGVLDARFVAGVWPLWASGWPDGGRRGGEPATTALVVPGERLVDGLAMAALGLRLGGTVPFAELVTTPVAGGGPVEVVALVEAEGSAAARVALLSDGVDVGFGRDVAARLDALAAGGADVRRLEAACAAALDAGAPAAALGLLAAALAEGVPPEEAPRVRALAAPFVGA
ncbi:MAG TPA: class I tRNA ligase family protein [Acidimicrobiales bacterium]|nr:class I tRNA ligase family protein [Acidimicrobiales bacterium]